MKDIDHEYTEEIVCPWCGDIMSDSWEWSDEGDDEVCDECGKEFSYIREVEVTYSTTRKKCGECNYDLKDESFENPSIHHGKNFCTWTCEICEDQIIKTGGIAEDNKPYIIPIK